MPRAMRIPDMRDQQFQSILFDDQGDRIRASLRGANDGGVTMGYESVIGLRNYLSWWLSTRETEAEAQP